MGRIYQERYCRGNRNVRIHAEREGKSGRLQSSARITQADSRYT